MEGTVISSNGFKLATHRIQPKNRTALLTATLAGHLEIVQFLASRGASVKERDTAGYTPLLSAAFRGHLDIVK